MPNPAATLIRDNRALFVDRLTGRIVEALPRYGLIGTHELRQSVDALTGDVLELFDAAASGQTRVASERMTAITKRRVEQGLPAGDFLTAILLALPVTREFLRTSGRERDPELHRGFEQIEQALHLLAATAAGVFAESARRQLEGKNQALNRMVQELQSHERALSSEASQRGRQLDSANEFNRRVLESLSSGVVVISAHDAVVRLFSTRCEEILGLAAEDVVGKRVDLAIAGVEGLDMAGAIETVRTIGHFPMTKVRLVLPTGRVIFAWVRAQRMYDADGQPEGTVVLLDDVSERELLIDSFSRYVSRDVVHRLLARARGPELEGERRTATLLFADIRGFTGLAERESPERLHALLNAYFRVMITAITTHGGIVDKFIGDKVMALFTTSGDPAVTAENGVKAAIEILRGVKELSGSGTLPSIELGVGVNTGEVMIGNVGSEERMEFTAIGDAVNVADRLQSIAKAGEILIGARTAALLEGLVPLEERGPLLLKGREATERVWAVK